MVAEWYYEIDGEQHGPLSAGQLRKLAASGTLQAHHLLWKEGMQKKVRARSIKGLLGESADPAAAPAPSDAPADHGGEAADSDAEEEPVEAEQVEEGDEVEEVEEAPEVLTEASVTYRKGLPGWKGPVVGILYVETTGLRFESGEEEYRIPFHRLEDALAPVEGDFPPAALYKAFGAKVAGRMGKIASGMVGNLMGGVLGSVTKKAGEEASKMVEEGGQLGKSPRNRITLLVLVRKRRCRFYFDVNGDDRREMNHEAQILFGQLQKARCAFNAPEPQGGAEVGLLEDRRGAASEGGAAAGQRFRVLRAGRILGVYAFAELRRLLGSSQLKPTDLIGVEAWVPVSSLGGLLLAGPAASSASGAPAESRAGDEGEEEAEGGKAEADDDGPIPVDDKFMLDG